MLISIMKDYAISNVIFIYFYTFLSELLMVLVEDKKDINDVHNVQVLMQIFNENV